MPLERALITCMGSSALLPARSQWVRRHGSASSEWFPPSWRRDATCTPSRRRKAAACVAASTEDMRPAAGARRACNRRSATLRARARMTGTVSIQEAQQAAYRSRLAARRPQPPKCRARAATRVASAWRGRGAWLHHAELHIQLWRPEIPAPAMSVAAGEQTAVLKCVSLAIWAGLNRNRN